MDYAKLLTNGVGAWLNFEAACGRTSLFSEKYMAHPIGQILNGASGGRTVAEYKHPVLAPQMSARGRRPELDFVVLDTEGKVALAVESKWIGRTTPSVEKIFWDLIRLEMLANRGIRCLFLLGGKRKSLEQLFEHTAFDAKDNRGMWCPLLRWDNNVQHNTTLGPTVEARRLMLRKLFRDFQTFQFPHAVVSRRTAPFPADPNSSTFQVYAWEIKSPANRMPFQPRNSAQYHQNAKPEDDE
ncbi:MULTISPECIES: hypothetical protein [unclassified Mesorhizobium]|uniref:hypothetical protein n=1 Tax=unclassified Mesorhizobium TaxID=325217 RepID=UPI000FCA1053|nr:MULTISPECIES: hypothetical protein [unclassified Mesorhizobium]RUX85472.1 hypothetical protein EN993_35325 [Mesorhizobium sp. M7D.F.Ca.US.004.01.2.1]RVA34490.1 hypothetical protein EN935_06515 [Mesorhizobium sp. M7D.F.Ca.US.004.03.1.1]